MAISMSDKYVDMLELLLKSMTKHTTNFENTHIYILVDDHLNKKVTNLIRSLNIPNTTVIVTTPHFHQYRQNKRTRFLDASAQRLRIYEQDISRFTKVLYLDVDIILTGNINNIFEIPLVDKLHTLPEGTIQLKHAGPWGGSFFRNDKKYIGTPGINAGILLYNNTPAIHSLFNNTIHHIEQFLNGPKNIPGCLEQPFLSYNTIVRDMSETQLLPSFAMLHSETEPEPSSKLINHFSGWIGNHQFKLHKMNKFYDQYIS